MPEKQKRVLVLGACGAMGQYLVPILSEMGYLVDGIAFNPPEKAEPGVRYFNENAKDIKVLQSFLSNHYDGIVDFLTYPTGDILRYLPLFMNSTDHYIFLSSCRVFADEEHPVRESSPRLLDASKDPLLLASDDYCMYKARAENVIRNLFPRPNWTIVRPATTYSFMRYQLVTLEAPWNVGRALRGLPVAVPEQARLKPATMTWGGDAAMMIAKLLFNEKALGEDFNVCTAEHHTWEEIAEYYKAICSLKSVWIDKEDYLKILNPDPYACGTRWQLEVARMFNRTSDNTKVLNATGLQQKDFRKLYQGLEYEISRCPRDFWPDYAIPLNDRMTAYLEAHK